MVLYNFQKEKKQEQAHTALSTIHASPATDSTCKRYLTIASFANLVLRGKFWAIVVKVRLCKVSANSNDIADFSRRNGRLRSNAHRYNRDL